MKKVLALKIILILALFAIILSSCGADDSLSFKNQSGFDVHNVYFSEEHRENWGDAKNYNIVENNITFFFNLEGLKGDDPAAMKNYDIGIVDENGLNYDIFGVALGAGYKIILEPADGGIAKITVTDKENNTVTYEGVCYMEDEAVG
jgi:hypothetical protein